MSTENKISSTVYCTLQYEALHNWPTCDIDEVDFLKYPHRHMFHIKAFKKVDHDDRDIEFIVLKRKIARYLGEKYNHDFGPMSCEMIARELIDTFNLSACDVSEDNENGCFLQKEDL